MTRRRRARPLTVQAPARPPGWFTEPVRAWFGAHWQPATEWGRNVLADSERAREARGVRVAAGDAGSIAGLSRRSDALLAAVAIERARKGRGR